MGREEEVREKWRHACRSDNNKEIRFSAGPWPLVAKVRGWGGWAGWLVVLWVDCAGCAGKTTNGW